MTKKLLETHIDAINHELKSPLTTIKLSTDILQSQIKNPKFSKDYSPYLERINSKIDYLTQLINSYTDLLKIQNNFLAYHDETLTLHKLIDNLAKENPTITFNPHYDTNQNLTLDVNRFSQIVKALTFYVDKNLPPKSLFYLSITVQSQELLFSYYAFKHPKSKSLLANSKFNPKTDTSWNQIDEFHIASDLAINYFKHYRGYFFHFYNSKVGVIFQGSLHLI